MSKGIAEIIGGAAAIAGAITLSIVAPWSAPMLDPILFSLGASLVMAGIGTLLNKSVGLVSTLKSPVKPWDVIYGECSVPGTLVYVSETSDGGDTPNVYMHQVIVLASHPCDRIGSGYGTGPGEVPTILDGVWLNQKRILFMLEDGQTLQGSTIFSLQSTRNILTVSRVNDQVSITCDGDLPLGLGDDISIGGVTTDPTVNGIYVITASPTSASFTFTCGGAPVNITGEGQAESLFPNYNTDVYAHYALGDQTAANPPFPELTAATNGQWAADAILEGMTAVYLRWTYDSTIFANGLPNVTFRVRGKNTIFDPRTNTTGYSANAALCVADYLADSQLGFKASYGTEIPDDMLIAASNVCDEGVTTISPGGSEPRYEINGTFDVGTDRGTILQNMLTAMGGRLVYSGGQFQINPAAWTGSSATFGGAGNPSIESLATGPYQWKPKLSSRELYNAAGGKFVCLANQWAVSDIPYYAQDATHGYSNGPAADFHDQNLADDLSDRRTLQCQMPFTTSVSCAQRLLKVNLMRLRQQGRATFALNMGAYRVAPLDVITVTLPALGWTNKLLEVSGTRLAMSKPSGDGGEGAVLLGVELDLQETSPDVYDWTPATEELSLAGFSQTGVLTIPGQNASRPASPTNLVLVSGSAQSVVGADGIARSRILATWTAASDGYVVSTEIQYQATSASSWTALANVSASATQAYIDGVTDGTSYNARIRAKNVQGAASAWVVGGPVLVSGTASVVQPSSISATGSTPGQVLSSIGGVWTATTLPVEHTETPIGTINGMNTVFTLSYVPTNLYLNLNGVEQDLDVDYTLSGLTITYTQPLAIGDIHTGSYNH